MKHRKKTMRYKLILWFCLLIISIMLFSGLLLNRYYKQLSKSDIRNSLREISQSATAQIESSLDNLDQTSTDLQRQESFLDAFALFSGGVATADTEAHLLELMENAYLNRNNIRRVVLLCADGRYLSTGIHDPDLDELERIYRYAQDESRQRNLDSIIYYPVQRDYMDAQSESNVLTAITTVRNGNQVLGYILIQQNISYYDNALSMSLSGYPVGVIMLWRDTSLIYSNLSTEKTEAYTDIAQEYSNRKETPSDLLSIQFSTHRYLRYIFTLSKEATSERFQMIFQIFLLLLAATGLCTILFIAAATHSVMQPLRKLTDHMATLDFSNPHEPELAIRTSDYETDVLLKAYRGMLKRQKETNEKARQLEQLQARTLFSALQSEISPHFMLNTLGSVAEICEESGAANAADVCYSLANILHYTSSYATEEVLLSQEIDNLEAYLKLMKVRYRTRLNYAIHVDEKCKYLYMPKLVLQPLVENSLKYARETAEQIHIWVDAVCCESEMCICVCDNGCGITQNAINKVTERFNKVCDERAFQEVLEQTQVGNMGLSGTLIRLKLFYGEHFNYTLDCSDGKTSVILKIQYKNYI